MLDVIGGCWERVCRTDGSWSGVRGVYLPSWFEQDTYRAIYCMLCENFMPLFQTLWSFCHWSIFSSMFKTHAVIWKHLLCLMCNLNVYKSATSLVTHLFAVKIYRAKARGRSEWEEGCLLKFIYVLYLIIQLLSSFLQCINIRLLLS